MKYIETLPERITLDSPSIDEQSNNARNGGVITPEDQPGNQVKSNRVSTRTHDQRKAVKRLRDTLASCVRVIDEKSLVCNVNIGDLLTYKAATKAMRAKASQDAVDAELDTLRNNRTWVAFEMPGSARPLHSKWVFRTNTDADGNVE